MAKAKTKSGKIKIAFIGSGGIMNWHVDRLKGAKDYEITALCDPSAESIRKMKEKQPQLKNAAEYEDWKDLLKKEDLDAVEIGSPHTVHYEQICASMEKGLHVLVEKPMTCTSAHARDVIARQKKNGLVVGISYQRHFDGNYRHLKELVSSGQLGDIQYVQAYQAQEWLRGTKGSWRQTQALSGGGQLNDSGSHLMDMLMWTTGLSATEVSCRSDFFGTEVDINSALNVKFSNGALGVVSIVGNAPSWWEDFTIVGSNGAVYNRNGEIQWQIGHQGPVYKLSKGKGWMDPDTNFIGAIRGECEIGCPPEIGLRVIEITEAAWRSHDKNGAVVKVEK